MERCGKAHDAPRMRWSTCRLSAAAVTGWRSPTGPIAPSRRHERSVTSSSTTYTPLRPKRRQIVARTCRGSPPSTASAPGREPSCRAAAPPSRAHPPNHRACRLKSSAVPPRRSAARGPSVVRRARRVPCVRGLTAIGLPYRRRWGRSAGPSISCGVAPTLIGIAGRSERRPC